MLRFWITEVRLGRQYIHDEIRIGERFLDDSDAKSLAILDNSLFKSAHSIAETFCVALSTLLLHVHKFIGFGWFHLH
jgi:hypothetical protein